MPKADPGNSARRIDIAACMDRQSLEALHLEIRALARQYGAEVEDFKIGQEGDAEALETGAGPPVD